VTFWTNIYLKIIIQTPIFNDIHVQWVFDGLTSFQVIDLFKLKLYFKIPRKF